MPRAPSNSLFISSSLALLSYVPFSYVSKLTFVVLLGTFILDPFDNARVYVLPSLFLLLQIVKWHTEAEIAAKAAEEEAADKADVAHASAKLD